jgi:hypothetical protein
VTYLHTLRLFFDGGMSNDYRLNANNVEFRTNDGEWRVMLQAELELHYRFNTEVARWLRTNSVNANPHASAV